MTTARYFFGALSRSTLLFFCLGATPSAGESAEDELIPGVAVNERVLAISGDAQNPVRLEVTLLTPSGAGPFPLAVLNHGATNASAVSRGQRYRKTFLAFYFLSRGYAVALPMMRGFGDSGGQIVTRGCDYAAIGRENARDIRVIIDFLSRERGIDGSKIVVGGQSFGGWNTLALGANRPANVMGLINFNGGLRTSDCAHADRALVDGAGEFGRRTFIPSIWFYGDNDSLFPSALWRAMLQRYLSVGARAELIAFGRFNADSHQLLSFPEGLAIWAPKVDAFLARIDMPNRLVHPEYLPKPWPGPTHFARIEDVGAAPYLSEKGRAAYRAFLQKPIPRVFLISGAGSAVSEFGGFDPLERGRAVCRQAHQACRPYAIDDQIVFTPPPPRPPAERLCGTRERRRRPLSERRRQGALPEVPGQDGPAGAGDCARRRRLRLFRGRRLLRSGLVQLPGCGSRLRNLCDRQ